MDYKEIVLRGYCEERNFLNEYFILEFRKAENIKTGYFFDHCLEVANNFEQAINDRYQHQKGKLNTGLALAKQRADREAINEWGDALLDLRKNDLPLNLVHLSGGKYTGNLSFDEVLKIKEAIIKARQSVISEQLKQQVKPEQDNIESQINTAYNPDRSKCTIAEYEAGTHRKIRTIETIEGFAVYLSYKCYAETFFINAYGEIKGEKEKTAVFDNYYKDLFQKHKNKAFTIDVLSNTDFLKKTYKSEVENLEKFKKYIKYFDAIKNKDNFLQYCDSFILWIERKQTKKAVISGQERKQVNPKMTAPLLALCLYFLKESNYIKGTLEQKVNKTKELLDISVFKFTTIKKEYYQIGKGKNDPLNTSNILNALEWLQDFPEATRKAKAILKTFE